MAVLATDTVFKRKQSSVLVDTNLSYSVHSVVNISDLFFFPSV